LEFPALEAVIVVVPLPAIVTTPVEELMVATFVLELEYEIVPPKFELATIVVLAVIGVVNEENVIVCVAWVISPVADVFASE
jgi:hypothetical protein